MSNATSWPGSLLRGVVVDGGVITVAATLLTLPLAAYHFHRVSMVGLLATFIVFLTRAS